MDSTSDKKVFMPDIVGAHRLHWDLKKYERVKAILRNRLGNISSCVYDPEVKAYYFYLKI